MPRFGDGHNLTEESDGNRMDADTNFGNLVRLANEKMAKTINLHDSGEDSFRNMNFKSKPKSFKRNY